MRARSERVEQVLAIDSAQAPFDDRERRRRVEHGRMDAALARDERRHVEFDHVAPAVVRIRETASALPARAALAEAGFRPRAPLSPAQDRARR